MPGIIISGAPGTDGNLAVKVRCRPGSGNRLLPAAPGCLVKGPVFCYHNTCALKPFLAF